MPLSTWEKPRLPVQDKFSASYTADDLYFFLTRDCPLKSSYRQPLPIKNNTAFSVLEVPRSAFT